MAATNLCQKFIFCKTLPKFAEQTSTDVYKEAVRMQITLHNVKRDEKPRRDFVILFLRKTRYIHPYFTVESYFKRS